ncbi:MAG: hypothetical protein KGJ30_03445 [Burkholderiales bacterium]|nr:hypothetical protein [Burkholderiales bacterium]MDE1927149.1 hypothetical protein [Burkholderiales bacterium]MDE2157955.1 hypothetical protein [Burkholderiales bacterium]
MKQAGDGLHLPIRQVEVFGVAVPLAAGGFRNAYMVKTTQRSVIVRVRGQDGAVGLGNIDPSPGYSVETVEQSLQAIQADLGPAVIGCNAANVQRLLATMDARRQGFLDAKAAIEMACIDMVTRHLGIPVHQYLGGAVVDTLRFNAWVGIVPPDEAAAEALKWQSRGFRSAKVKIGGGILADRDRLTAVRQAVGPDMALRVDANAGYDVEQAIELGRMLEPLDIELFEQPVAAHDLAGMARVRSACAIPVMADESITDHASLIEVIKAGCADIVKLKVMKQGGFTTCRRMVETASAAGLRVVIGHGFGLGVNTVAEIMLASTSSAVMPGLECVGPLKTTADIITRPLDLGCGTLALPEGPGLGVELDEANLARFRFA